MGGACREQAVGEIGLRVLGLNVQRLLHGGRVLELDPAAFQQP